MTSSFSPPLRTRANRLVVAFVTVALVYFVGWRRGMSQDEVRALAFFAPILTIIGLILVNRAFGASLLPALRRPNPALVWILAAVQHPLKTLALLRLEPHHIRLH